MFISAYFFRISDSFSFVNSVEILTAALRISVFFGGGGGFDSCSEI